MNALAAEALYEAERKGVRQVFGTGIYNDSMCGLVVILKAGASTAEIMTEPGCPLCGPEATFAVWADMPRLKIGRQESGLIVHLNDDHGLTFSEIARKLGPDSV